MTSPGMKCPNVPFPSPNLRCLVLESPMIMVDRANLLPTVLKVIMYRLPSNVGDLSIQWVKKF